MESTPKNDLAATASQLLDRNRTGSLATLSVKHEGFPFASQSPYAVIQNQNGQPGQLGLPIFLFSDLSVHSKNLRKNPKATLLIQSGGDMQQGRVSLMGTVELINESLIEQARQSYLARHPEAQQWISFGDFRFYAMSIVDCYVVAGFGNAGWVKVQARSASE